MNASVRLAALGEVTAIIVTFQPDRATVSRQLAALAEQVALVVIVDNASTISPADWLPSADSLQLIRLEQNFGVAAAQNIGIAKAREAGADYVLLLDQDSIPESGMVQELRTVFQALELNGMAVAAVGPRYHEIGGKQLSDFVRFGLLGFKRIRCRGRERSIEVDFLISSGSLIALDTLERIGVMDEGLFIDHVDTEWFLRARAQGWRAFGACNAIMEHRLGQNIQRIWLLRWRNVSHHTPFRYYYIFRNSILLYRRPYVAWRWLLCDLVRLTQMALFFGLLIPPRGSRLRMIWRGALDGIRGITGPLM